MNKIITIVAAGTLFSGIAYASPEFDNHANYGTVIQDVDLQVTNGTDRAPTGHLVPSIASSDSYGSALFDLDRSAGSVAVQPAIGDQADDAGNILYDVGARY